jgi:hypothetical protein
MILAIPTTTIDRFKDYFITISYIPPIITLSNSNNEFKKLLEKIYKENSLNIEFENKLLYYSSILGGIIIFLDKEPIVRIESNGYIIFNEANKGEEPDIKKIMNTFTLGIENCFRFEYNTICYKKNKCDNCKWIDNIGIRFIKDTL